MWISNIQKTNPKLHKEAVHEDKQFRCLECEYQSRNKVTLLDIKILYIMRGNFDVNGVNIRQLGKVT